MGKLTVYVLKPSCLRLMHIMQNDDSLMFSAVSLMTWSLLHHTHSAVSSQARPENGARDNYEEECSWSRLNQIFHRLQPGQQGLWELVAPAKTDKWSVLKLKNQEMSRLKGYFKKSHRICDCELIFASITFWLRVFLSIIDRKEWGLTVGQWEGSIATPDQSEGSNKYIQDNRRREGLEDQVWWWGMRMGNIERDILRHKGLPCWENAGFRGYLVNYNNHILSQNILSFSFLRQSKSRWITIKFTFHS